MVIFWCLTVFWLFLTNGTLYQSSKSLKTINVPIVTGLPRLYQQCTNGVPIAKTVKRQSKQQKWPLVYQSSHVYQDCTNNVPIVKNSQNSTKMTIGVPVITVYQDCANRVPTVYQNSQKTDKIAKMTIGVPIITGQPRLYQQCNNSLPIVNKNLAIANRSCVSCGHNTSRAFIGLNITPWPWNLD